MNLYRRLRRFARPLLALAIVATAAFVFAGHAHAAGTLAPALRSLFQEAIQLPPWFIGAGPALAYGINWVIIRAGGDAWSPGQKQNVVFAVNAALFAGLVLTGQIAPPEGRPTDGLIASWTVYAGALFVWIHKGSNAIADVVKAAGALMRSA